MFILDQLVKRLGRNTVTVLLFHKVPAVSDPLVPSDPDLKRFERVLDFVMERFHIVPLGDVATGLSSGKLPRNTACITFDDGYPGWLEGVVPALRRRNAHATFFLTTAQFDGTPMWHERVVQAVRHVQATELQVPGIDMPTLPTRTLSEKRAALAWLQEHLKYQPVAIRNVMMESLEIACGVDAASVPCMSLDDLRAIHSKGFAIGAHTVNHPILKHTTPAEAVAEIGAARERLEGVIRGSVDSFAYPNGRPSTDFMSEHIAMVRRAGYQYAVTTQGGVVREGCSVYQMPRFTPWGPDRFRMLAQVLRNQVRPKLNLPET